MISRIELENFKGIRDPVSLDLKPITLLFGANSSGKSTVIHALHYALEVLKNHNLDADRTTLGGEAVDLGGFGTLVHAHDLDRRIRMLFEFDVDGSLRDHTEGISDATPADRGVPGPNDGADLEDRVLSAWVRVEVGWSRPLGGPQVFFYEVGVNGNRDRPVVRIEAAASKGQTASLVLRVDDAIFAASQLEVSQWEETRTGQVRNFTEDNEMSRLLSDADIGTRDGLAYLPVYEQESALPTWGRPLRLWLADDTAAPGAPLIEVRRTVSRIAVGIGELLVAKLERLLYVGPLRTVPPRNYRPPLTEDLARWAEGLGAWDALHRRETTLVSRTSEWMRSLGTGYRLELRKLRELEGKGDARLQELLGGLFVLQDVLKAIDLPQPPRGVSMRRGAKPRLADLDARLVKDAVEFLETTPELIDAGLKALQTGRLRDELVLVDERSGVRVQPYDVGVGISQVLPVVVAALYRGEKGAGSFVAVEQPELHVHPKLQVILADLFVEQGCAGTVSDHQFLLETHSEHILLRFLRRIRETHAAVEKQQAQAALGRGAPAPRGARTGKSRGGGKRRVEENLDDPVHSSPVLTPDKLSVIYVERAEDGSPKFHPLRIDDRGEFLDVWPEGFFEERDPELFG
jgi:hypothetical protein